MTGAGDGNRTEHPQPALRLEQSSVLLRTGSFRPAEMLKEFKQCAAQTTHVEPAAGSD
jgi:hypothetical protein